MARVAIGEEIMLEAIHGHIQRVGTTQESIAAALTELDVSPDEVAYAFSALADQRDDGSMDFDREIYIAACLDACIVAFRAARIAEERSV